MVSLNLRAYHCIHIVTDQNIITQLGIPDLKKTNPKLKEDKTYQIISSSH